MKKTNFKENDILIGNVMVCTCYKRLGGEWLFVDPHVILSELFQKNVRLVKIGEHTYKYFSYMDYPDLCRDYRIRFPMVDYPSFKETLFVDESSLRLYYTESNDVSVRELRRG